MTKIAITVSTKYQFNSKTEKLWVKYDEEGEIYNLWSKVSGEKAQIVASAKALSTVMNIKHRIGKILESLGATFAE